MGKTRRYEKTWGKKPKFNRNKKKKSRAFSEQDEEGQFDPIQKSNDPLNEVWEENHESDRAYK